MEIHNLLSMDGNIVIGIVNEKLRLECDNMAELVSRYELDEADLVEKMERLGYHYNPLTNQFR